LQSIVALAVKIDGFSVQRATAPGIISGMIETSLSPALAATIVHRVIGVIDRQQAEQGAAEGLRFVQQVLTEHDPINLLLDLRGKHFQDLQAHKAWSEGFARNPVLQGHVRSVAIIGDDTPAFRAEQELMDTERVRFFVDVAVAQAWLAQATSEQPRR
jgi:SpoIIAA-like